MPLTFAGARERLLPWQTHAESPDYSFGKFRNLVVVGPLQTPVADAVTTGGVALTGMLRPPGHSQRRVLYQIERSLLADDPFLESRFAIFTRLTCRDAMPGIEQAKPRQWRQLAIVVALLLAVLSALVLSALVLIMLAPGPHRCGPASAPGQRHSAAQAADCMSGPVLLPGGH
jgi:Protein of unknown function (DUF3040)